MAAPSSFSWSSVLTIIEAEDVSVTVLGTSFAAESVDDMFMSSLLPLSIRVATFYFTDRGKNS